VITVKWIDRGRRPTQKPNPNYPDGIDLDMSDGAQKTCTVKLEPYPTPRCGLFAVSCSRCSLSVLITTAGRPDDPRSVKLACQGIKVRG